MNKETTIQVSATVLGQKRAEYLRLKDKGLSQERITQRMEEDCLQFGITMEEYQRQLDQLGTSHSGTGIDVTILRKEHTSKINVSYLDTLARLNGIMVDTTLDTLKFTKGNFDMVVNSLKSLRQSLSDLSACLSNSEFTTKRGSQSWCVLLHAPVYNNVTDQKIDPPYLFAPLVGGWTDKGRTYDQYGTRMEPSPSKSLFYRSISYERQVTPISNKR